MCLGCSCTDQGQSQPRELYHEDGSTHIPPGLMESTQRGVEDLLAVTPRMSALAPIELGDAESRLLSASHPLHPHRVAGPELPLPWAWAGGRNIWCSPWLRAGARPRAPRSKPPCAAAAGPALPRGVGGSGHGASSSEPPGPDTSVNVRKILQFSLVRNPLGSICLAGDSEWEPHAGNELQMGVRGEVPPLAPELGRTSTRVPVGPLGCQPA